MEKVLMDTQPKTTTLHEVDTNTLQPQESNNESKK